MADNTKIDYIADRLDNVAEKVDDLRTTLTTHVAKFESHVVREEEDRAHLIRNTDVLNENTASLKDHMKRTEILERYVKAIDDRFTPVELELIRKKAVSEWLKSRVIFIGKLGGAVTALGAIGAAIRLVLQNLQ
jgi:hypothetical protein